MIEVEQEVLLPLNMLRVVMVEPVQVQVVFSDLLLCGCLVQLIWNTLVVDDC